MNLDEWIKRLEVAAVSSIVEMEPKDVKDLLKMLKNLRKDIKELTPSTYPAGDFK